MIQYEEGNTSRIGNRGMNQDRGCVTEHGETLLILIADGMGGHKGGELAAQEAMDCFISELKCQKTPLKDPAAFIDDTLKMAHHQISQLGTNEDPPFYPRTTCVACIVQEGQAFWSHLGDSRLYVLRDNDILDRTRDHTYIEELYQNEVISEEEMLTHPMRNYVTYCLGGPNEMPPASTGYLADLQNDDLILLCTDGMWGAMNIEDITHLGGIAMDTAINRMTEEAERISHPHSDNVTLLGIKVLDTRIQENSITMEMK